MRRDHVLAVSSATLFLSTVLAPCHFPMDCVVAVATSPPGACILISEFYPCGLCDDEYFVLVNRGDATVDLWNWTVTDGEGTLRFVHETPIGPGGSLVVSSNKTSYEDACGRAPEISLDQPEAGLHISVTGTFRLADTGDSIALIDQGGLEADFVAYGACTDSSSAWSGECLPGLAKGEVARRFRDAGSPVDSDSMADWLHFREFEYGYTDLQSASAFVEPGMLRAFVSPDCGLSTITGAIASARSVLRLCAYEMSSPSVCSALLSALSSGVQVKVLVDGAPAGGMDEAEIACLSSLSLAGADVRVLKGNLSLDVVQHVGPMHAKYVVVDDLRLVVLSENFVESGLPSDPLSGNRGWGVDATSTSLAGHMCRVFDEDSRGSRPDVLDWADDPRFDPGATVEAPDERSVAVGIQAPMTSTSGCAVTLLFSPDASISEPFLCPLLRSSARLCVEQFQADLLWEDGWTGERRLSPLVSAVEEALARGGEASVLLDSLWFNEEGNGEVAEHLNSFSASNRLRGEARLMDLSGPVSILHNKGLVVDGRWTVVSSNNWGSSSFARNRELAMVVDSEEVARYFDGVFEMDWEPDTEPPVADAGPDVILEVGGSATLDGTGSSDDRFVASWEWRLDGDGLLTAQGDRATFVASRPGTQTVHLLVTDAWGNTGVDTVTVEVVPEGAASGALSRWLIPSAAALGLLSSVLGAAFARKLNHGSRSSR